MIDLAEKAKNDIQQDVTSWLGTEVKVNALEQYFISNNLTDFSVQRRLSEVLLTLSSNWQPHLITKIDPISPLFRIPRDPKPRYIPRSQEGANLASRLYGLAAAAAAIIGIRRCEGLNAYESVTVLGIGSLASEMTTFNDLALATGDDKVRDLDLIAGGNLIVDRDHDLVYFGAALMETHRRAISDALKIEIAAIMQLLPQILSISKIEVSATRPRFPIRKIASYFPREKKFDV